MWQSGWASSAWSILGEAVAHPPDCAYFCRMPEDALTTEAAAPNRATVLVAATVAALLLAGTVALWAHYGTAVFFETIRAGFAACFG